MRSNSSNTPGRAAPGPREGAAAGPPGGVLDSEGEASSGGLSGPDGPLRSAWRSGIRRTLAQAKVAAAFRGPGASPPPFWVSRSEVAAPPAVSRGAPTVLGQLGVRLVLAPVRDGGPANLPVSPIAGVPVASARVLRLDGPTSHTELDDATLEIDFGLLNEAEFQALHAALGGRSAVPFEPARAYAFQDFLPPAAQAVLARGVVAPPPLPLEGTGPLRSDLRSELDLVVSLTPNSHGATWELARAYQASTEQLGFAFYYLDPLLLRRCLEGPRRFSPLGAAEGAAAAELALSLRAGDVVGFYRRGPDGAEEELLHSAVAAGAGLFLEKPDAEGDELNGNAYRLVSLEQATRPLVDRLGGERPELRAFRPLAPLRPAAEAFKTPMQAALDAWASAKGRELGRPLLTEYWIGTSGGVIGEAVTAVEERPVALDARGRGVLG